MSCNEKSVSSKNKHYTLTERKVFLQILEKYKNVVEVKKNDATTLKDKDIAWNEICEEYNQSSLICQEVRTNLKYNIYFNTLFYKTLIIENCIPVKKIMVKSKTVSKKCLNQRETITFSN